MILIGYLKASIKCVFDKKIFGDNKKINLHDKFFVSNQNFTTNLFKILGFSWIFNDFCSKFQDF